MPTPTFKVIHYCSTHHGYVTYKSIDRRFVGKQQDGLRWFTERQCPACAEKLYKLQRALNIMREGQ